MTCPLRLTVVLAGPLLSLLTSSGPEPADPRPRLKHEKPPGRREKLGLGTLFLPAARKLEGTVPLFVHFHGGDWLPEVAAAHHGKTAVLSVQLGSGSAVYGKPFRDPQRFARLLAEAEGRAGVRFAPVTLTAWSAGYGAVLRHPASAGELRPGARRVARGRTACGLRRQGPFGYARTGRGTPGCVRPLRCATPRPARSGWWLHTPRSCPARMPAPRRRRITCSRAAPGAAARRKTGPLPARQLSEARRGGFLLLGFAGNTAADHVDQLHALPEYLKMLHVPE